MAEMAYASLGSIRLYYEVHGQGQALVLIPGMGADHSAWFRQLPAFRRRFKVVTFDPRSIGKRERPKQTYSLKTLAEDVVGLMDHLLIKKAHILGQSLGGFVAQEVAIDFSDRVLKLILVSTAAGGDNRPTNPALMKVLGQPEGGEGIDYTAVDTRKTMNAVIGMSFNKLLYRKAMQFASRIFVRKAMLDGLSDQMRAVSGYSTIDRLHLIKAQTLVITGAEDRILSPSGSELLASKIPKAKLIMVKDGSHGFNVEMAARFNREVLDFLRAE